MLVGSGHCDICDEPFFSDGSVEFLFFYLSVLCRRSSYDKTGLGKARGRAVPCFCTHFFTPYCGLSHFLMLIQSCGRFVMAGLLGAEPGGHKEEEIVHQHVVQFITFMPRPSIYCPRRGVLAPQDASLVLLPLFSCPFFSCQASAQFVQVVHHFSSCRPLYNIFQPGQACRSISSDAPPRCRFDIRPGPGSSSFWIFFFLSFFESTFTKSTTRSQQSTTTPSRVYLLK